MILTFMGHLPPARRCSANFQGLFPSCLTATTGDGVIVVLPFKERAVTEAVTSNLQGTKWQPQGSNPDHLTPPEPVVLTLPLCARELPKAFGQSYPCSLCFDNSAKGQETGQGFSGERLLNRAASLERCLSNLHVLQSHLETLIERCTRPPS